MGVIVLSSRRCTSDEKHPPDWVMEHFRQHPIPEKCKLLAHVCIATSNVSHKMQPSRDRALENSGLCICFSPTNVLSEEFTIDTCRSPRGRVLHGESLSGSNGLIYDVYIHCSEI